MRKREKKLEGRRVGSGVFAHPPENQHWSVDLIGEDEEGGGGGAALERRRGGRGNEARS